MSRAESVLDVGYKVGYKFPRKILITFLAVWGSISFSAFFETIQHFTDMPYINFELFMKCGWKEMFTDEEQLCHGDLDTARKIVKPIMFYLIIGLTEIIATTAYFYFVVHKIFDLSVKREQDEASGALTIKPSHRITYHEFGFCKSMIFGFTEIPILMILEFYYFEILSRPDDKYLLEVGPIVTS